MHIQIVNFNLKDMTHAEYETACEQQFAPAFREVAGLITKVWLSDPATNTYGGVYTWRDRDAMEEFSKSALFHAVVTNPHLANLSSRDFSILPEPTRTTRGLVGEAVSA